MIAINHILCPVDFSDIARHAVDHAAALAHWYRARLTLLYVFANLPTMNVPPPVLEEADRERLQRAMHRMAGRVPEDVAVDYLVEQAPHVHDEISWRSARSRIM